MTPLLLLRRAVLARLTARAGGVAVAASLALAPPAAAATLAGTLTLREADGAAASAAEAFVWFTPATPRAARPQSLEITTRDKTFLPRAATVPVGSTVRFPNADPILHNVFSVSSGNRFDLGLYRAGQGKPVTLRQPGIVRIFCNVHRTMAAFVAVIETPYVTAVDARGHFTLADLPEGPGTLTVWHWRAAAPESRAVTVPLAAPVAVTLEARLTGAPPHLNKTGKPYTRDVGDTGYR